MAPIRCRKFVYTPQAIAHVKECIRKRGAHVVAAFDVDGTLSDAAGNQLPAADLLRWIAKRGGTVDIITARPEESRPATLAWLRQTGLLDYVSALRMPARRLTSTAAVTAWKRKARAATKKRHGRLDVAVGDNVHDVAPIPVTSAASPLVLQRGIQSLGLVVPPPPLAGATV